MTSPIQEAQAKKIKELEAEIITLNNYLHGIRASVNYALMPSCRKEDGKLADCDLELERHRKQALETL